MEEQPKVLVISHNCFSKGGANGRTLANFFTNWPKKSLAQFYINNEIPDSEACDQYFRVTDIEALRAFYKGSKAGRVIKRETQSIDNTEGALNKIYKRHNEKKSVNYIIRNLIWDSNRWKSEEFDNWVDNFKPDLIFLQIGDYAFMIRIALKIAKKLNIPIVIYNCEDFYFRDRKSLSPIYNYYRKDYKRQVKKLISYSSHCIYNSDMLQHAFQNEFAHESSVIMTATSVVPKTEKETNSPFIASYLGNLGLGRHESLIEIAEKLHDLHPDVFLDVYGKVSTESVENAFRECDGIRLKGYVSYDEVVEIMKSSDLLVHAESFSEKYQGVLKNAFSTKIADSLASGTCFFVYAPENIAFVKYLKENQSACVATNKQELDTLLRQLILDEDKRRMYIANALETVKVRHNAEINEKTFDAILCSESRKVSQI